MSKLLQLITAASLKERPKWALEFEELEDDKTGSVGGRFWPWIDAAMERISKDELFCREWREWGKDEQWNAVMLIAAKLREQANVTNSY